MGLSSGIPPITVCTPTIPIRVQQLGRAVSSVANQTLKPAAHVIMVDVHREGAPIMLDKTVTAAQTEWVAILADDDEFLPNHLETLWNLVVSQNADIGFTHFRYSNSSDAGHLERFRGQPFDNEHPRQMTGVFLARRNLLLDVGGHSTNFDANSYEVDKSGNRIGEDFVIVQRLAKAGARFAVSPEVTWIYHVGHGNTLGMPNAW
jgi:hypothetical protein